MLKSFILTSTVLLFSALLVQSASALVIDFEEFSHGDVVTSSQGVTFNTTNIGGGPDLGVAFGTGESNTADPDLEQGGGWSTGNLAPNTSLSNILIIQENRRGCSTTFCDRPDDEGSRGAGSFEVDFSAVGSFQTFSMDLVDVENYTAEPGKIEFFDGATKVSEVTFMEFLADPTVVYGDNSANRISDIFKGTEFDRVRIHMGGSGGVDNITVTSPVPEPAAALLFGFGLTAAGHAVRRRR